MRYQNLTAFQKQLRAAAPHHLCKMYLVAVPDDFERAKAIDLVLPFLHTAPTRLSANECALRDCFDAMQNGNLFGDTVVVLDEVEKFSKKETQLLADGLRNASGFVILGARSKVAPIAAFVEKEGIVLDLLEEKPWDKEKRLQAALSMRADSTGKKLDPNAAALLLERIGPEPALLESEIDKLICYVGEKPVILCEDVLAMSSASNRATLWQMAEEVIWEKGDVLDASQFHALLPALRSQLHVGLSLATLIEEGRPSSEWGQFLPKMWPKTLEKRSSQAARLGSAYFRKGLAKLFEIELLSRSDSTQYEALLSLFRAYVVSAAKSS